MLAGHLTRHLRDALKPLTFTDEDLPVPEEPVAAVNRSTSAQRKVSTHQIADGTLAYTFEGLLRHLATQARNTMTMTGTIDTFELLASPTQAQHQALNLNHPATRRK